VEEQVGYSCVANTCAGAYEYLAKRNLGEAGDVSRLFIYFNARVECGDEDEDAGTTMLAAIDGLKKYGACREDLWPNDENAITQKPATEAYNHAANFKIAEAEYAETDLDLWRHTLADGYPIAFCLNTFSSFDDATNNRGRVPMPKKTEQEREEHGWHAMLCVGYLDKDQMFIVRNSWGNEWGNKGYCYIPYKYAMHGELNGHDSWVVKSLDDLDFSMDIESEDESSYFADEGSIQLFDFYVATEEVEDFATALEALCGQYANDESFYFDYEGSEEDDIVYAIISNFDLSLDDPGQFLEDLDSLCKEWAEDENYNFDTEGYGEDGASSDEEPEAGDDAGEELESDDEAEADDETLALTGFYIYTENGEKIVEKIDRLCAKHSTESDHYAIEWEENEDDNGTYIEFSTFAITPDDSESFLAELEALCENMSNENGYNWE
jgi:hypothetical protein